MRLGHEKTQVVAIIGPTGVGKTDFSLKLAGALRGEIVSCDSMQIYQGMDIGTAKATPLERQRIPHHCLDIVQVDQNYSVADYQRDGRAAIKDIEARGKFPTIVGGTGLYLRALLEEYDFEAPTKDMGFREELFQLAAKKGNYYLHEQLQRQDPQSAAKLHPNDLRRIIRALEYHALTGQPISEQEEKTKSAENIYSAFLIGLIRPREILYERINTRVHRMIELGLLEEIESLLSKGLVQDSTPGQALGYKEFFPYFAGEKSLDSCIELLKRNSRRYAKRQLTWFRARPNIHWYNLEEYSGEDGIGKLTEEILSRNFFNPNS